MTTANDTETVVVDDTDTDRITYSGSWKTGGIPGEFNQTSHGTNSSGAFCTFTFNGTSVTVVGTVVITPYRILSTYVLDNDPVNTFLSPPTATSIVQVPFYQSAPLADITHTLIITAGTPFRLDYILYTIVDSLSAVPLTGSNTSLVISTTTAISSTSSAVGSTNVAVSTPPSLTPTSTKPAPIPIVISKPQRPVGAIIGGYWEGWYFY